MTDSSPKLKEAMAEIKAVLMKHDIAGHILLHEYGFSEFMLYTNTSWSVVHLMENGIRIRSKIDDFDGDKNAKRRADEASLNMLAHFADLLDRDAAIFRQLSDMLTERWDAEHTPGVITTHRSQ